MGSFRFRRSIRLAPGVRVNLNKRSIGISAGVPGARVSINSNGRSTRSVGVPGTGLYYRSQTGRSRTPTRTYQVAHAAPAMRPGLFAPKAEKQLFAAIHAQDWPAAARAGDADPRVRVPAYTMAGLMLVLGGGDRAHAQRMLEIVFAGGEEPLDFPFMRKYVEAGITVNIAPGVAAPLGLGRTAVGLVLAEMYQADGQIEQAIATVKKLAPTQLTTVSLAELDIAGKHFDELLALTNGVTNTDDASALLCVYRGVALREQGYVDAALDAFKAALHFPSRSAAVRHLALSERAEAYRGHGQKALARKDLEHILSEDSSYEGIRERITELTG